MMWKLFIVPAAVIAISTIIFVVQWKRGKIVFDKKFVRDGALMFVILALITIAMSR